MPTLDWERELWDSGVYCHVAGLDEAGRGALAGPVVAAAVILPPNQPNITGLLQEVDDSKRLPARRRERLFDLITGTALTYGIGSVTAVLVDELGIIGATKLAMQTAVSHLTPTPDYLLIDGRIRLQQLPLPQQPIIRGDSASLSIAAASILAKVSRDQAMIALDCHFPHYGFARHKGYGTVQHRQALADFGPCPEHRRSFTPLRLTVFGER
jgi:ribonuclease HII